MIAIENHGAGDSEVDVFFAMSFGSGLPGVKEQFGDLGKVVLLRMDGQQDFLHDFVALKQPGKKHAAFVAVLGDELGGQQGQYAPAEKRLVEGGLIPEGLETVAAVAIGGEFLVGFSKGALKMEAVGAPCTFAGDIDDELLIKGDDIAFGSIHADECEEEGFFTKLG